MQRADRRMVHLRDLLHHAGLKPMTQSYDEGPHENLVFTPNTRHKPMHIKGKVKKFCPTGLHTQLPEWLDLQTKQTMMAKISDMTNTPTVHNIGWTEPIVMGRQLESTMLNRNCAPNDMNRMVNTTLRASNKFMGQKRRAEVKVHMEDCNGRTHLYFAR